MRALALPGCGCRIAFQFGVLEALEARGETFAVAAGASSGSLAAAAFVSGRSSHGPAIVRSMGGTPVFSRRWLRSERSPFGMSRIVRGALEEHLPEAAILSSETELLVSTTNLRALGARLAGVAARKPYAALLGEATIHSSRARSDLHDVLIASCTFPPFYARLVRLGGEVHVDGGATDNTLVGALVARGATHVTVITPHVGGLVYRGLGDARRALEPIEGVELRVISPREPLAIRSFDFDAARIDQALSMPWEERVLGGRTERQAEPRSAY